MKIYLMFFLLILGGDVFCMKSTQFVKPVKDKDYFKSLNHHDMAAAHKKYCEKVSSYKHRTHSGYIFSRILGGGVSAGIFAYIGNYTWFTSDREFLTSLVPFLHNTDLGDMPRRFITGASLLFGCTAAYYALMGIYDWFTVDHNEKMLKHYRKMKQLSREKEREKGND